MYIGLAALAFTFFAFFEEKINRMDFNLTRAEWLLLIFLWGLAIHANRNQFYKQWQKFRKTPFIFGIRNRFFKREPLIFDSGAHATDLSFLKEGTESHKRWPKNY